MEGVMSVKCRELLPSLQEVKGDLYSEVNSAEGVLRNGIEVMWGKVTELLQGITRECEKKCMDYEERVVKLTEQISSARREIHDLDNINKKIIADIDNLTKEKNILEGHLQATQSQLQVKEEGIDNQRKLLGVKDKKHQSELTSLQKQIEEQSSILEEYQSKVTMTTGKMQKLSQQMKNDRTANEKAKKSHASELLLQSGENKKLTMEISKLKLQISAANKALVISKEHSEKLEQKMRLQLESTVSNMEKKHLCDTEVLKEKISLLQQELDRMKVQHHYEMEQLKKRYAVEQTDFIDARIAFLHHQNRQEKEKSRSKKRS